jgi:hypothetical protein
MISQRSRYANATVSRVPARDGVTAVQAIVPAEPEAKQVTFAFYRWTETDRIDNVARYFFEDETAWWVIADANPEILMWDEVEVGTIIRIPNA